VTDTRALPPYIATGSRGAYDWLTTEYELETLLELCPELLLNKYLAVTSIDSGFLTPSDSGFSGGWESRGNIAYSPRIESVKGLPYDGYDEWYVFPAPVDLGEASHGNVFEAPLTPGRVEVFVNYGGFGLHIPEAGGLEHLFWKQLDWIQPESYIGDGSDCLTLVSKNTELFVRFREALKKFGAG
jgi:hypothetical protein